MEYIVLGKDGKEYGPVDADTLQVWVEHGRVLKDTQIRNSLMKKWNEAGTLDILEDAFSVQQQNEEAEEGVSDKLKGMLFGKKQKEAPKEKEVRTAFRQKYIPNPATVDQRMGAFLFDSLILCAFGLLLFIVMNIYTGTVGLGDFSYGTVVPIEDIDEVDAGAVTDADTEIKTSVSDQKIVDSIDSTDSVGSAEDADGSEEFAEDKEVSQPFVVSEEVKANIPKLQNVFYKFFGIFVIVVLLYYGIGLGLFAQTFGMHYWGIFIVKGYNDEVFAARAFAFVIAMFAIGVVTPIVVALNPQHRSIHGYLTGTRLIRIAAKPKA